MVAVEHQPIGARDPTCDDTRRADRWRSAPSCAASRHRRVPTCGFRALSASTPRRFLRRRCWYSIQRSSSAGHTVAWLSEPTQMRPPSPGNGRNRKSRRPRFASVVMRHANRGARGGDALELGGRGMRRVHQAPVLDRAAGLEQQLDRAAVRYAAEQASTSFSCSATWMCTGRSASMSRSALQRLAASSGAARRASCGRRLRCGECEDARRRSAPQRALRWRARTARCPCAKRACSRFSGCAPKSLV